MRKRPVLTGIISRAALAAMLVFGVISCKDPTGTTTTTYTATYAVGRGSGDAPAKQTVDEGTDITLPVQGSMTAPSGETFDGWKDGGGTAYTAGTSYTVTANVLFTAQWKTSGGEDGGDEVIPLDPPKSNLYIGTATTPVSAAGTTLTENLDWLDKYAATPGVYTIKVSASGSMDEIELKSDRLGDLSSVNITITTAGTAEVIIALKSNGRLFTVGDWNGTDNITLTLGGSVTLRGRSSNICELVRVNGGGTLNLTGNVKITGNNSGSGVQAENGGTITMSGGKISGNNGGGVRVYNSGTTFTMSAGEISGNTAGDFGGVKVGDSATFNMTGGKISGNTSVWEGGGVRVEHSGSTFNMSGGEISGNTTREGGGVAVDDHATFTMSGTAVISGNTAREGGGMRVREEATFNMTGGTISSNTSTYGGGGVRVRNSNTTFNMSGGTISNNTAEDGGGVTVEDNATFNMSGTAVISGNTARGGGGGVRVDRSTFILSGGTTISNNTAGQGGGVGMWGSGSSFTMTGGTISGNIANDNHGFAGAGLFVYGKPSDGGTFSKTGGIIYGDTDNIHTPGSTENTATHNGGQGHAVWLYTLNGTPNQLRNATAGAVDDISWDGTTAVGFDSSTNAG
ncbi:hypothetical protein FACS1894142_1170 [Spirochaetia bacterium]|nr:hypothetical protein FACS1894142_1170 [Spirochaetia bacterium]